MIVLICHFRYNIFMGVSITEKISILRDSALCLLLVKGEWLIYEN